jgi:hypothetical protein
LAGLPLGAVIDSLRYEAPTAACTAPPGSSNRSFAKVP